MGTTNQKTIQSDYRLPGSSFFFGFFYLENTISVQIWEHLSDILDSRLWHNSVFVFLNNLIYDYLVFFRLFSLFFSQDYYSHERACATVHLTRPNFYGIFPFSYFSQSVNFIRKFKNSHECHYSHKVPCHSNSCKRSPLTKYPVYKWKCSKRHCTWLVPKCNVWITFLKICLFSQNFFEVSFSFFARAPYDFIHCSCRGVIVM